MNNPKIRSRADAENHHLYLDIYPFREGETAEDQGARRSQDVVPLAVHLNVKAQLRDERQRRKQAEATADKLQIALAEVLKGINEREEAR
jgi:hypothetical protein